MGPGASLAAGRPRDRARWRARTLARADRGACPPRAAVARGAVGPVAGPGAHLPARETLRGRRRPGSHGRDEGHRGRSGLPADPQPRRRLLSGRADHHPLSGHVSAAQPGHRRSHVRRRDSAPGAAPGRARQRGRRVVLGQRVSRGRGCGRRTERGAARVRPRAGPGGRLRERRAVARGALLDAGLGPGAAAAIRRAPAGHRGRPARSAERLWRDQPRRVLRRRDGGVLREARGHAAALSRSLRGAQPLLPAGSRGRRAYGVWCPCCRRYSRSQAAGMLSRGE